MIRVLAILCAALALALYTLYAAYDSKTVALGAAQEKHQQADARAESLASTLRLQRELAIEASAVDARHTKELTDARIENERLRDAVAAGEQRLLLKAACPRVPSTEPAGTARLDDGVAAELAPAARPDYFALRAQLSRTETALAGLQEYVAGVCLR